jgi:DNA-binding NarL/FixJ family response regulator
VRNGGAIASGLGVTLSMECHRAQTIAFDLAISARTVEIYRANVMTKMDAASLSELVRMALSAGILGEISK